MKILQFDVVIVGGGVIGVSAAYALCREQKDLRFLLLEAQTIAHASARSPSLLTLRKCLPALGVSLMKQLLRA